MWFIFRVFLINRIKYSAWWPMFLAILEWLHDLPREGCRHCCQVDSHQVNPSNELWTSCFVLGKPTAPPHTPGNCLTLPHRPGSRWLLAAAEACSSVRDRAAMENIDVPFILSLSWTICYFYGVTDSNLTSSDLPKFQFSCRKLLNNICFCSKDVQSITFAIRV